MDHAPTHAKGDFVSAERFTELLLKAAAEGKRGTIPREQRQCARLMYRGKVLVTTGEIGLEDMGKVSLLRDVSSRGIGLLNRFKMKRNSSFRIKLPMGDEMVEMLYNVVSCEEVADSLYRIGAELVCVAPQKPLPLDSPAAVRKVRDAMLG